MLLSIECVRFYYYRQDDSQWTVGGVLSKMIHVSSASSRLTDTDSDSQEVRAGLMVTSAMSLRLAMFFGRTERSVRSASI